MTEGPTCFMSWGLLAPLAVTRLMWSYEKEMRESERWVGGNEV